MTTEKTRLAKYDRAKREALKKQNQVKLPLTLHIAEERSDWQQNWRRYRNFALSVARVYCTRRGLKNLVDVRDQALSEAWRYVCEGDQAEKAIVKAVNKITMTASKLKKTQEELPEVPAHDLEWYAGESRVSAIVASLPERLRPLAIVYSAGIEDTQSAAQLLGVSDSLVRRYRRELATELAELYPQESNRHNFLNWLRLTFAPTA